MTKEKERNFTEALNVKGEFLGAEVYMGVRLEDRVHFTKAGVPMYKTYAKIPEAANLSDWDLNFPCFRSKGGVFGFQAGYFRDHAKTKTRTAVRRAIAKLENDGVYERREAGAITRLMAAKAVSGMSLEAIARAIGVSYQQVWRWVNGLAVPTTENAKKILEFGRVVSGKVEKEYREMDS